MYYNNEEKYTDNEETELILYPTRWIILTIFCGLSLINSIIFISFGSINSIIAKILNVSQFSVNLLSLTYFPSIIILMFAPYLIQRLGLKKAFLLCGFINVLGTLLRWGGSFFEDKVYYWFIFAGQMISTFNQPILLSAPVFVASTWFGSKERSIATSIGTLSVLLGIAIGMLASSSFVRDAMSLRNYLLFEFLCSCASFLSTFFSRAKPMTPPSVSQQFQSNEPLLKQIFNCVNKMHFWLLCIPLALGYGVFTALTTLINQLITPYGYSTFFSGLVGFFMMISGTVGGVIFGLILDKTRRYTVMIWVGFLGVGVGSILIVSSLRPAHPILLSISFVVYGFFSISMLPTIMEACAEVIFPVSPLISSAIITLFGSIFSVVYTVMFNLYETPVHHQMRTVFMYSSLSLFMAPILLLVFSCTNPIFRRKQYEDTSFFQSHSVH
eukprot:TRINITY_DN1375_c0_g2_i1.p1 TRINITY_DN1375_c0_g2~~TRINITY_DN1375_c0_g2_i1.p1  ORF type:complete len:441 (+),score=52.48 TRINITY_DN1375_c0_g2_i1:3-1325(+)